MKTDELNKEETQMKVMLPKSKITPYPYSCVYIFPLISIICTYNHGLMWDLIIPSVPLIILPTLELIFGMDGYNPTKEETKHLESLYSFRLLTWLWVPWQILYILTSCVLLTYQNASFLHVLLVAISTGMITGGIGITVAHELIHKNSSFEQNLGKSLLASVMYLHFYPEHLHGHHKRVATKEDPATSRYGETLYQFLPRTIIYSYLSAWKIESKRMQKLNLSTISWSNTMIQEIVYTITTTSVLYLTLGPLAASFWVIQSFVAIVMLEIVNYIEHYGLQRKVVEGSYERVTPFHSWNADHWVSNYVLFKLQRHADHHTWPYKRYQTLRNWDFSPQLPTGYSGMMVLSLFPPLYFAVMNPKVERYNNLYHGPSNPTEIESEAEKQN